MLANMMNYGRAIRVWLGTFPSYPGPLTIRVAVHHTSALSIAARHASDAMNALGREMTKAGTHPRQACWKPRRKTKA